jgi:DNA-binding MarR family transcriptional regulator
MAETLAVLRDNALITSETDPDDRRKTLIRPTPKGRAIPAIREAWLNTAIAADLGPDERRILHEAAALMNRVAESTAS